LRSGEIFDFATAIGWPSGTSRKVNYAARMAVCAFATLLGLLLAAEARAGAESASSGDVASAVDEQPVPEEPLPSQPPEQPPPVQPPAEQPAPEQPPAEQPPAEQPPAEQPAPEQPPAEQPPPEQPSAESPPPAEAPPPAPPADPPAAPEPTPISEAPVVAPPPGDLASKPPDPDAGTVPAEVETAVGSRGESIVTIRRSVSAPRFPSLLPSPGGGDRLATQNGSRSEPRNERPQAAESAGHAPLLPAPPFGPGAPADLYVGAGGMGGGSSGGFFPLVLAVLVALFVAVAQRPGGLVPVTLARPRCTALLLCLERPD
jgi:hypothetical protein